MPGKGTRLSVLGRFGFRRPSPATLIAVIALSVAVGGSATAAVVSGGGPNGAASAAKKKRTSKGQRTVRLVGPKGQVGDQGPQGAVGPQGPAGADSVAPGPQGETGEKGDSGMSGTDGTNGEPGAPGTPGTNGVDGLNGVDGRDGRNGDTTVRYAARIDGLGNEEVPAYSNGLAPRIAHTAGTGDYEIVFAGPAATRMVVSATATLEDDITPASISTQVNNQETGTVVTVNIRQLPAMGGKDLPFAVQVLKMVQ